jgi:hypothetical protein
METLSLSSLLVPRWYAVEEQEKRFVPHCGAKGATKSRELCTSVSPEKLRFTDHLLTSLLYETVVNARFLNPTIMFFALPVLAASRRLVMIHLMSFSSLPGVRRQKALFVVSDILHHGDFPTIEPLKASKTSTTRSC